MFLFERIQHSLQNQFQIIDFSVMCIFIDADFLTNRR